MTHDTLDRMPPCNANAERGLIASVMLDPAMLDDIGSIVRVGDFYQERHRLLFGTIWDLHRAGGAVGDMVTLSDELNKAAVMERIGGEAYLAELLNSEAIPLHAPRYASIIAEKAERRRLIAAGYETANAAFDGGCDLPDVRSIMEKALADDGRGGRVVSNSEGLADAVLGLDETQSPSISTGFERYDAAYGGICAEELIILAAKTGGGKSAFALQVAEHIAKTSSVLYVSLEMGSDELHRRRVARESGVSLSQLRTGSLSAADRLRVAGASERLSRAKLFILDDGNVGVADVAREARRLKRQDGLGLIVVDYLQLLRPDDSKAIRERQVAALSRGFKVMARELHVPVIVLCQLNRQADKDEEPRLSHLRESGAIEQDADVVAFVHRCGSHDAPDAAKLIVGKHRHGKPQSFSLEWDGPALCFREVEPEFWTPSERGAAA